MDTRRLLILADFLESIPENFKFNLSHWGEAVEGVSLEDDADEAEKFKRLQKLFDHTHQLTKSEAKYVFVDCGYSACAVGHACLSHKLRAEGLDYRIDEDNLSMIPLFEGFDSWSAVCVFFDLESEDAHMFFDESRYNTRDVAAKDVAARIREKVQ